MNVAINNITTTITVPQVDFNLLKELAKKFGWVIQTEKKSGIEEALEDVKAGRNRRPPQALPRGTRAV